jgi:hypothetical protein
MAVEAGGQVRSTAREGRVSVVGLCAAEGNERAEVKAGADWLRRVEEP